MMDVMRQKTDNPSWYFSEKKNLIPSLWSLTFYEKDR